MLKGRIERRAAGGKIEIKRASDSGSAGQFEGYAALFSTPHPTSAWSLPGDWVDVISPGAFSRTLAEHKANGTLPALCFQHNVEDEIGKWGELVEDATGLRGMGEICDDPAVPNGARTAALMRMGAARGLSIGFIPSSVTLDDKSKTRTILDTDLFEISCVTIPGIAGALVDAKRMFDPSNPRELEIVLRDAGLSRNEAKRLIADGIKALAHKGEPEEVAQRDAEAAAWSDVNASLERLQKTLAGR